MSHYCHARGCTTTCPPTHLMCAPHWGVVPATIKAAILREYVSGQCNLEPPPSEAWHIAADAAIGAVGVLEGAPAWRVKRWVSRLGTAPQALLDALDGLT